MNTELQIKRYEEIERKIGDLNNEVQKAKIKLEYDKNDLKEMMDQLKEKGIDFNNISELEKLLEDTVSELSDVLDATERKLEEADQ